METPVLPEAAGPVPFSPVLAAAELVLATQGFRLGRGQYVDGCGDTYPTLVIDRPDAPEWAGVWYIADGEDEEAMFILDLIEQSVSKWCEYVLDRGPTEHL